MNEPNYEYVKGQGWIVMSTPVTKTKCGKLVRLEFRVPEMGEHYDFFQLNHNQFFLEGQPIWSEWVAIIPNHRLNDYCTRDDDDFNPDVWGYVVLVPV